MVQISSKSAKDEARPPLWKVWLVAARPHTLTAAVAPCIAGSCATFYQTGHFPGFIAVLWASFCILIQLGTNLHNDYADFVKGADTDARVGHSRATQKGWLTPSQTAQASTVVLSGAVVIGVYFLLELQAQNKGKIDHFFLWVVITSVFNAFAYTGGPYPLGYIGLGKFSIGYMGLGDVFVFLYFGLIATGAIPYLHDRLINNPGQTSGECLERLFFSLDLQPSLTIAAVEVGFLATNIIVVNNLRDRNTDVHAGKRTLAVRFGPTFCRVQYTACCVATYVLVLLDYSLQQKNVESEKNFVRLWPMFSLPLARQEVVAIWQKDGAALNAHVGKAAMLQFVFCILLGAAFLRSP